MGKLAGTMREMLVFSVERALVERNYARTHILGDMRRYGCTALLIDG